MPLLRSLLSLSLALGAAAALAQEATAPPPDPAPASAPAFPGDDWPSADPAALGLDAEALARLDAWAFRRDGDEQNRQGIRTNALLIVKDGAVVYERYARGTTATTPLLTWSMTKSVANLLVGVAVREGLIDIQAPAGDYYPPLKKRGHQAVKVVDLLQMSSGIEWGEAYETSPLFSSVLHMLYTRGSEDMAAFTASFPQKYPPGTHWSYSSGDTNLLMGVLRGVVPPAEYPSWPWTKLFDPLGMERVTWERDAAGTFVGSSYLYAPAREVARLGWLMIHDGQWDGRRILPEGWVDFTTTMAPAYYQTEITPDVRDDNPGAQWYLNKGDPARNIPPPWPDLPADTIAAFGHWGKSMYVIPSWNMVVVRLGDDRRYACTWEGQEGCEPDPQKAFSKPVFTKLLAEVAR